MMRLDRLELTRYGRFTDRVIDFGTAVPGQPDLHIVFGVNEAGKSTLLSAWLDLLFGIPSRSRFGFLHDYKTMQVGARVTLGDRQHALVRTKGMKATLTEGGVPFPEAALAAALGHIDRAACADMFALDATTMQEGGEAILSSQGNLGELLFTATAGLSNLGRRLEALRQTADAFWRKSARSGGLKDLRAELDRIDRELAALDVQAPDFARRRAAVETARAEHDRLAVLSAEAVTRHALTRAKLDALPVLHEWREQSAELAPLQALPDAPDAWSDRVTQLIRADIDLTATARATALRLEQQRSALEALVADDCALALADASAFDDQLKAHFLTARSDLPKRQEALTAVEARLDTLAAQTGLSTSAPALDAATLTALEGLATLHTALAEKADAATREREKAEADLAAAGGELETDDGSDRDPLRAALEPLKRADLDERRRVAREDAAEAAARRDAELARLAPWHGDATALRALAVPAPETLARWRARLDSARAAHDLAVQYVTERRADADRRIAAQEGLARTLGNAAPEALAEARAARDDAWRAHRAALDGASADRFAAALAAHDRATETQLARAGDIGQLHALRAAAATAALESERAASANATALRDLVDARRDVLAARVIPGGDEDDPLAGLSDWLTARQTALDLADSADTAERAAQRADQDAERARVGLAAVLGKDGALQALTREAEARLTQLEAEATRRSARRQLTAALAERRSAESAAIRALEGWRTQLAETLQGSGLEAEPPAPARLHALLPLWRNQAQELANAQGLRHRIATMQADQTRFATAVAEVAKVLEVAATDTLSAFAAAADRVEAARRIKAQRQTLATDIATTESEIRQHDERRARLAAEAGEIMRHLGVETLSDAQVRLTAIARRAELRVNVERRAADLRRLLGTASVDEVAQTLADADPAALHIAVAQEYAAQIEAAARLVDAQQAVFAAERDLESVTGAEIVARLDAERATVLMRIGDAARDWLRERAGILATTLALDAYRASHRGTMLTRASEAFAHITAGAYKGLAAQPSDKGDQLIALGADGASKAPDALSKGTRFQLYLALRIAGFAEWTAAHGAIPVVADDIMETFDDARTALALQALSEMSRGGQVIYMTHHRSVCDLAREVCPEARLVDL